MARHARPLVRGERGVTASLCLVLYITCATCGDTVQMFPALPLLVSATSTSPVACVSDLFGCPILMMKVYISSQFILMMKP